MKRLIMAGLLSGTLAAGGIAYAQAGSEQRGPGRHMLFDALDSDKDGTITRAEAVAAAEKRFAETDTDRNGVISQAERDAMHEKMREEHFKRMDTDGNGQLSREEFRAAHDRMRSAMGADEKGEGSMGKHRHHHGMGMMGKGMGRMQGDISKEQFLARPLAMFDRIDANKDGRITAQERDAAHKRMMERWKDRKGPSTPGS